MVDNPFSAYKFLDHPLSINYESVLKIVQGLLGLDLVIIVEQVQCLPVSCTFVCKVSLQI